MRLLPRVGYHGNQMAKKTKSSPTSSCLVSLGSEDFILIILTRIFKENAEIKIKSLSKHFMMIIF